jgi:uncharacterized protein
MAAYFRFVLRHRLAIGLLLLVVTVAAGFSLSRAVISSSIGKLFFGDAAEYKSYQERARRFTNDEKIIVGYEDADPLSGRSLRRLRKATEGIRSFPEIESVVSLLSAQRIYAAKDTEGGESLVIRSYGEIAEEKPEERGALLAALQRDEMLRGLVVSENGKHAALVVELKVDPDRSTENLPAMMDRMRKVLIDAGYQAEHLHFAGSPPLLAEMMVQTYYNISRLLPFSTLALLIIVFFIFRRFGPAILALGISWLAVLWTMGLSTLIDPELNIMMSVVPGVVLIVAFSDIIHLFSAYQVERRRGKEKEEAIIASASDVGRACLLTSATTFVGFICLSIIPTPVFRQLGVVLGFGVGIALVLAMTIVPIVLSFERRSREAIVVQKTGREYGMDWLLNRMRALATERPGWVIAFFGIVTAGAIWALPQLNIDTNLGHRMSLENRYRKDQDYFKKYFASTNLLELFLDLEEKDAILDAELFARIEKFQKRMLKDVEVDSVVSLSTLIKRMHHVMGAKGELPTSREALAQYLLLFEMSGGKDLKQLISFDRKTMRVGIRIKDHHARGTFEAGKRISALGSQILGAEVKLEATGLGYLVGWWLNNVVLGQRTGLLLSMVVIALMMIIGLRSLRVGLISMVPNILPLLFLGAYVALTRFRVDSDTLIIAMMAIGIGVDDTIHFLMRYRLESKRAATRSEALERTYNFSGRAIVITTLVLTVGFVPYAFSHYYSISMMGTLLPLVLFVALVADLLLLPALVKVGVLRFSEGR